VQVTFDGGVLSVSPEHWADFSDLIDRVSAAFVGRQWLLRWIDDFLARNPSGYLRILADAGLGKTALAAYVARRYQGIACFVSASEGRTQSDRILNILSTQLIARYTLPYGSLPADAGETSDFLVRLIGEARRAVPQAPIILVLDALDEADPPRPGHNWVHLPTRMPDGAYFVITHRPGDYPIAVSPGVAMDTLEILSRSREQHSDVAAYIERWLRQPEIARILREAGWPSNASLPRDLEAASEGNFMYVAYLLADIARGAIRPDQLAAGSLPRGLDAYYAHFWAQMATTDPSSAEHRERTATLLGVAAEPVTVQWFADHAHLDAKDVERLALAPWRRFLRSLEGRWSMVHRSFAEFLAQRLDLREAHANVARYYLADTPRWSEHEGYAGRWLSRHLRQSRDVEALRQFLANQDWYEAQVRDDPTTATYLNDLQEAWAAFEAADADALLRMQAAPFLGREVFCAAATSSLHSLSRTLKAALLTAVVRAGLWTPEQALRAARQNTEPHGRIAALMGIARCLPPPSRAAVFREAIAAAKDIQGDDRYVILIALSLRLARSGDPAAALDAVAALPSGGSTIAARLRLLPFLTEDARSAALGVALSDYEALDGESRVWVFPALLDHGPANTVLAALPPLVTRLSSEYERGRVVRWVLSRFRGRDFPQAEFFRSAARETAKQMKNPGPRACLLASVIPQLDGPERDAAFAKALAALRASQDHDRGEALAWVYAHAPSGATTKDGADLSGYLEGIASNERAGVLFHAAVTLAEIDSGVASVHMVETLADDHTRDEALADFALWCIERGADADARCAALAMRDVKLRHDVVGGLVDLPEPPTKDEVAAELAAVQRIDYGGLPLLRATATLRSAAGAEASDEDKKRASSAARKLLRDGFDVGFVSALPERVQEDVVRAVMGRPTSPRRLRSIARLAGTLSSRPRQAAVAWVQAELATLDRRERAEVLATVLPHLPVQEQGEAVLLVAEVAWSIVGGRERGELLERFRPHLGRILDGDLLDRILKIALAVADPWRRVEALCELARAATTDRRAAVLEEAVRAARALESGDVPKALAMVAALMTGPVSIQIMKESVDALPKIENGITREYALRGLLGRIGPGLPEPLVREALEVATGLPDFHSRGRAVQEVIPFLGPDLLPQALTALGDQGGFYLDGGKALAAARMAELDRSSEALALARQISGPYDRARALVAIVQHRPERDLLEEARSAAESVTTGGGELLAALVVPFARAGQVDAAVGILSVIKPEAYRVRALEDLAAVVEDEAPLAGLLAIAGELKYGDQRAKALNAVVARMRSLSKPSLHRALAEYLHTASRKRRDDFIDDLNCLVPLLAAGGSGAALLDAARALEEASRRWP
jgi:hypothetical protein